MDQIDDFGTLSIEFLASPRDTVLKRYRVAAGVAQPIGGAGQGGEAGAGYVRSTCMPCVYYKCLWLAL
jgi:hypothetical protein